MKHEFVVLKNVFVENKHEKSMQKYENRHEKYRQLRDTVPKIMLTKGSTRKVSVQRKQLAQFI